MKKTLCTLAFLAIALPTSAKASHHDEEKFSLSVSLNSDTFFGFNPFFQGAYELSDSMDFTFYGIQWSGGTGAGWGNWSEFGVGAKFKMGHLSVTPQFGLLNGNLVSAGGEDGRPRALEGYVPNLTVNYEKDGLSAEFYGGLYYGAKDTQGKTNNYLHYWLNAGYQLNNLLTLGAHYEHLRYLGGQGQGKDAAYDYYAAVGPFVQFSNKKKTTFVRFMAGPDLRSEYQNNKSDYALHSFSKLTVGFSFN